MPYHHNAVSYAYPPNFDQTIGAWFLGPKAENHQVLEEQMLKIVRYFKHARESYFPEDPPSITKDMMQSNGYQASVDKLDQVIEYLSVLLSHHCVPFSSTRHAAHVVADSSLPAVTGYILGLVFNQNNVSPEASPLTSVIEYVVGQDFCRMLGYRTAVDRQDPALEGEPIGWGHVTCDGSVANYEGMWVARSLKFYPLSLRLAIQKGDLNFVASEFKVLPTGQSQEKLFMECLTWELLNLRQDVILGLADVLTKQFGISSDYINDAVKPYLAQTIGKDELEKEFKIEKSPVYAVSITKHYSIIKAANVLGIGEDNLVNVDIDEHARMDMNDLEAKLLKLVQAEKPVAIYGVLAIMGTTEHGAVDPVSEIIALRSKFERDYGVSFLIHCDAAWGGYFASIIRDLPSDWRGGKVDKDFLKRPLLPYTARQLEAMKGADSITLDPHKSGYCPYPAGGLCYRDERMRFLITTTSPYINTTGEGVEAMGTYGLEGSKPGAAPLAVWVSNVVLGLHMGGYGTLLSQAIISGVRYYTLWSTISSRSKTLIVTPFNVLPVEKDEDKTHKDILQEKQRLMKNILKRPYQDIIQDEACMKEITSIGSDLMINTFSCNFRLSPDDEINKDVAEANILNQNIYERLSIRRVTDDMNQKPVLLVGTIWEQSMYKDCLTKFKAKLGLDPNDPTELHAFSSVAMSPFVMDNILEVVGDEFQKVAEEEVQKCVDRLTIKPAYHNFLIHGTDKLFLTYTPNFYWANHRQQLILTADLSEEAMKTYVNAKEANPDAIFTLHTAEETTIEKILKSGTCPVNIVQNLPDVFGASSRNIVSNAPLTGIKTVIHHSLAPQGLDINYPTRMPFYLYGTAKQQHMDHVLAKAPNAQLSSSQVKLDLDKALTDEDLQGGLIAVLSGVYEKAMQPFSKTHQPDFFKPGKKFKVTVYPNPVGEKAVHVRDVLESLGSVKAVATGSLTLGVDVFTDTGYINEQTLPSVCIVADDAVRARLISIADIDNKASDSDLELLDQIMETLHALVEDPEVLLSHDLEGALKRQTVSAGRFTLQPGHPDTTRPVLTVSPYFLIQQTAMADRDVGMRKEWYNAVAGVAAVRP